MGSFFSATPATSQTTSNTGPWQPQQQYLTSGFTDSQNALNSALATPNYSGPFTAGFNQTQNDAQAGLVNYTQNGGQNVADQFTNTGGSLLGNYGSAASMLNGVGNQAAGNPTQQIIGNAAQYANNPYLQSQIGQGLQDINQNLQLQYGSTDAAASAGGNLDSTRTGVQQALNGQFADRASNQLVSGMESNAYNTGLGMAQNQYNQGMAQQLQAANGLAGLGAQGANLLNQGYNTNLSNYQQAENVGNQQQTQAQNVIQGNLAQTNYNQTNTMNLMKQYMGLVGGSYGSSSTSNTTSTPAQASGFQQALSSAMAIGGMSMGGPMGATLGGMAASGIGSLFGGGGGGGSTSPYGATGNGMAPIVGSSGMLGGGT